MSKKTWRLAAIAAAMSIALTSLGGGIASAEVGPANIDPDKTDASIVIHKKLNPGSIGAAATGEQASQDEIAAMGSNLEGVTFTATKLDLDLTDQADLATVAAANFDATAAEAYKPQAISAAAPNQNQWTGNTDAQGDLTFNVPVGVYLVEETITGDVKVNDTVITDDIIPAKPFVVRVPMTNVAGDAWNYNVHVYPKNSSDKLIKKVVDAGDNVGDSLDYTIDVIVPTVQPGNTRTKFVVADNLDETKLENWSVGVVKMIDTDSQETVFAAEDYQVKTDGVPATDKGEVVVTFTASGLAKLKNNASVSVAIAATIKADGKIVNQATRIDRDSSMTTDSEKPTNEVTTYLGKVKIVKQGVANKPLSGAQFELYRCNADKELQGAAIETLTTDVNGNATTKGLHVTDYENDAEMPQGSINGQYCLKETQAPEGYVLPTGDAAITLFTLTRQDLGADFTTIKELDAISNTPSNVPKLPLTGGQGIGVLAGIGVVLGGLAIFLTRRKSVKKA